jgi:hypothetical protein
MHALDPEVGGVYDPRIRMICEVGFVPWNLALTAFQLVPDWCIGRLGRDQVELRGPEQDVWARAPFDPDPQWLSAAASQHVVLAVYGPQLGVIRPEHITAESYGDGRRREELHRSCELGLAAAAIVAWSN